MVAPRKDGSKSRNKSGNPTARRAAKLYAENLASKNPKTDKEIFREAGYSDRTNTTHIVSTDRFQELLNEFVPKDKILKRINKGMNDDVKDSTALGYCRLASEIHGLVGAKANQTNVKIENATFLLSDLLGYSPPGVIQSESEVKKGDFIDITSENE